MGGMVLSFFAAASGRGDHLCDVEGLVPGSSVVCRAGVTTQTDDVQ